MSNSIGIPFANGIGNFIGLTAALKILKNRSADDKLTLITTKGFARNPALVELSKDIFDDVVYVYEPEKFDMIYTAPWCVPALDGLSKWPSTDWNGEGLHEIQIYLDMIEATWKDFDGFILDPIHTEISASDKLKIVLSVSSGTSMSDVKFWSGFPELSQILVDLGYEVYLLGINDELAGCVGHNFVDKLSIREAASVIQQCDLLICNSTGNAWIADAVGTPILFIEGPTLMTKQHAITVNWDVVRSYISCAPCFQKGFWGKCEHRFCMNNITPADVFQRMVNFIPKMNRPIHNHGIFISEREVA